MGLRGRVLANAGKSSHDGDGDMAKIGVNSDTRLTVRPLDCAITTSVTGSGGLRKPDKIH